MFKKIAKGIAISGAALALTVGAAQAETYEVNIYGASAQFKFWTAAAPEFLIDQMGCDPVNVYNVKDDEYDRDAGISVCVGQDGITGSTLTATGENITADSYIVRYTTNASYDGIRSIAGDTVHNADSDYNCTSTQRLQPGVTDASFTQYGTDKNAAGTGIPTTSYSCMEVHVGASDVAATTFKQKSEGDLKGPFGGDVTERDIVYPDYLTDGENALTGIASEQTVVVPFVFYANNGGKGDYNNDGDLELTSTTETPVPFDNLSRLMAVSLFSGNIANWNEFGAQFDNDGNETVAAADLPVVLCLRHAGSGTHATLDAAIMRGDGAIPQSEMKDTNAMVSLGFSPAIWFNKGSSDELRCVGYRPGAVGYADADKCVGSCLSGTKYGMVKRLTYQGVPAFANTIKHGQYPFWSAQWLYYKTTGDNSDVIEAMIAYSQAAGNVPASKADYWIPKDEMLWDKATDFSYPVRNNNAVN